jgi:hypothetical protein
VLGEATVGIWNIQATDSVFSLTFITRPVLLLPPELQLEGEKRLFQESFQMT